MVSGLAHRIVAFVFSAQGDLTAAYASLEQMQSQSDDVAVLNFFRDGFTALRRSLDPNAIQRLNLLFEHWASRHSQVYLQENLAQWEEIRSISNCKLPTECDFFIVSPHGSGLQSFQYYLFGMGLPSSVFYAIPPCGDNLDAVFSFTEEQKKRYNHVGITLDHDVRDVWSYHILRQFQVPVLWLVRDPVSLVVSCLNQLVYEAILEKVFANRVDSFQRFLKKGPLVVLEEILANDSGYYLCYDRQVEPLLSSSPVVVIDTADLMPDRIIGTLSDIGKLFDIDATVINRETCKISFNSVENRTFINWNPLFVSNNGHEVGVAICPTYLYDYLFNHRFCRSTLPDPYQRQYQKLGEILFDGTSYAIVMRINGGDLDDGLAAFNATVPEVTAHIRRQCHKTQVAQQLFKKFRVDAGDVISLLHNDSVMLASIRKQIKGSIAAVEQIAPDFTQRWLLSREILS